MEHTQLCVKYSRHGRISWVNKIIQSWVKEGTLTRILQTSWDGITSWKWPSVSCEIEFHFNQPPD